MKKKTGKDRKRKANKPSHLEKAAVKTLMLMEARNIGSPEVVMIGKKVTLKGWRSTMKSFFGYNPKPYQEPPTSKHPGKRALRKARALAA